MATDKPRFSITVDEDTLDRVDAYRDENGISTQSKAIVQLVRKGLEELGLYDDDAPIGADLGHGETKKAPSRRDEADEVADRYRALDDHGKGAVKAILDFEHAAAIAERRQSGVVGIKSGKVRARGDGFSDLRVYDQVAAAGLGNYLDSPVYHMEQYPADMIPDGTEFGIRISGNSMEPDIRDGSTAFVQSRSTIEPGSVGIFLLNGEAFCKRLEVDRCEGKVRLVSINKAYQPREIEEFDDFRTLGLVLGSYPK